MGEIRTILSEKVFKERVKNIFPDLKIISEFKGVKRKIKVEDLDKNIYNVTAGSLLGGYRPSVLSAENKNDFFIKQFKKTHGDFYDYSLVEYINQRTPVKIICPNHGIFEHDIHNHIKGHGCKECYLEKNRRVYFKNFIEDSNQIHDYKYDYSKVEYINNYTKVSIICKTHGVFKMTPRAHTYEKRGCRKCNMVVDTETFIIKANEVHNNKYDYNKTVYTVSKEKVIIVCKNHGDFKQLAGCHIQGNGCPKCAKKVSGDYHKQNPSGWKYKNWIKCAENSKYFESYKLYIIKCWDEEEEFYKIGRTFSTLHRRFRSKGHIPYNFEEIKIIESEDARCICELEAELKEMNREFKYKPKIKFNGYMECFSKVELDFINKCN